jgi:signal peptidase I
MRCWPTFPIVVHPFDKTDNYIKRCVGLPGDLIQVKRGQLFVNDQPAFVSPSSQIDYLVETNGTPFSEDFLKGNLDVDITNADQIRTDSTNNNYIINLTPEKAQLVKQQPNVKNVSIYELNQYDMGQTFPFDTDDFPWTRDNYGPLHIPKRGETGHIVAKEYCGISSRHHRAMNIIPWKKIMALTLLTGSKQTTILSSTIITG